MFKDFLKSRDLDLYSRNILVKAIFTRIKSSQDFICEVQNLEKFSIPSIPIAFKLIKQKNALMCQNFCSVKHEL